jgi:hypothetical protein
MQPRNGGNNRVYGDGRTRTRESELRGSAQEHLRGDVERVGADIQSLRVQRAEASGGKQKYIQAENGIEFFQGTPPVIGQSGRGNASMHKLPCTARAIRLFS